MADDQPELPLEPAAPVETPDVTPEPEPETVESLRADLEQARHERQMYEETLASLQNARGAATAAASTATAPGSVGVAADPYVSDSGITRSGMDRIKAQTGLDSDEAVISWIRIIGPILEEKARPLVGYLGALADVADRHEARLSVEGYKELEQEVEEEVAKMRAKGSHLPRTELAQLARAKKLPQLLKKEAADKKAAKAEQRSARASDAIETSTQKVGPTAGGRATPRSTDEVKGLKTREERIKALEEMAGNRTF
jgi:hypothetical protein